MSRVEQIEQINRALSSPVINISTRVDYIVMKLALGGYRLFRGDAQ